MAGNEVTWGGSLHQSWRLLPEPSEHLRVFLDSDGEHKDVVLQALPYDAARSKKLDKSEGPDGKRYRDPRHVYETVGFLYEDDEGYVHVSDLGRAVRRWFPPELTEQNCATLGKHAAYALAACQLRTPARSGQKYADSMEVFPFAFIWRAMLELDDKINSHELNRAIFKVRNADGLQAAIRSIRAARDRKVQNPTEDAESIDEQCMGPPTITGSRAVNDRIIPWMACASFGWTLILDKEPKGDQFYYVRPAAKNVLANASRIKHKHETFASMEDYINRIVKSAALPQDVR